MPKALKVFASLAFTICLMSSRIASAADSSDKTFDFRFSPIGLIVGSVTATLDIAVSESWTVGPTINYWNLNVNQSSGFSSNVTVNAFGIGARANWFKNGVYTDGLYIGPALSYLTSTAKVTDSNGNTDSASANGIQASALIGYGWFWRSFNMMLGAGAETVIGGYNISVTSSSGTSSNVSSSLSGFTGEFSLGWTF